MSQETSAFDDFDSIVAAMDDDDFPIASFMQKTPLAGAPFVVVPDYIPFNAAPTLPVQIGRCIGMDKRRTMG